MVANPLTRTYLFIEELRKLDAELPTQHAAALLVIARDEGITQQRAAEVLGTSKSGIQRAFDRLSDKGSLGKEGLGLIVVEAGAEDARQRCAFLTAKGRRFVNTLTHLMKG